MDVAYGTGVSASLCPHPQPKLDTPSSTASGQWTTSKPTSKLLPPHPREGERKVLRLAAKSGCLAIRRIDLTKEKWYLTGQGAPRPFSLALPGGMMPTEPLPERYGKWMVGIVTPQCLYVYKRQAETQKLLLASDATPENLKVKLLPDLQSLLDKRDEHANKVKWGVYPLITSGHLQENGTFSLPKRKLSDSTLSNDFPELVLTHYRKEDIKCFCVYNDTQANIVDILHYKRQCEKELELKPLPLVVYCHRTGSVQVYFDDELSIPLDLNANSLDNFAISQNVDPVHFKAMMSLLPMPLRAKTLSSQLTPDTTHKLQQAIELVCDPSYYSYEKLLELKQSGLPIHHHFFHERAVTSLLEMLLLSEMFRLNQPEQQRIRSQEEEAYQMFKLLLHSGARLSKEWCVTHIRWMISYDSPGMPQGIMNYMLAVSGSPEFLDLQRLRQIPLTDCPGAVVEFDRICRGYNEQQLQSCLEMTLRYVEAYNLPSLNTLRSHLLALFRYGASPPDQDFLDELKSRLERKNGGDKIIEDYSATDYIKWVIRLCWQRKIHPFYLNWWKHVEQAQLEFDDLKRSLALLDDSDALTTPPVTGTPPALQFMVDAFSTPPVLPDHVGDNEKTILKVLQHYYRRPGPERVIKSLGIKTMPTVWKPLHSCSHVLRARNNGLWYMELLEKFQLCRLKKVEKELLALAIIYHDAAAEDVDKSAEETTSADYFKRDLIGHYPEPLLKDMAQAMVSKENDVNGGDEQKNLSTSVRWYLRILRFADRMDIIRGCGVRADFPGLTATQHPGFDARRLDLPTQLTGEFTSEPGNKSEFQRHLEAAMHGAADLARITGQLQDHRKKDYTEVYGLNDNGSRISENFESTTEPMQGMNQFIDDNVRRKMARKAGIIVCSDPDHQACKADQNKGITYGIHNSWYDLRQVAIPAEMTLLEKMQYEHDPSLLSPATKLALEQEIQRLKSEGIRMNPGTLTQKTLASKEAQKVLKKRGIAVVTEKRPYFTNNDHPGERPMLVPKKILKLDAQQNAPAGWGHTIL